MPNNLKFEDNVLLRISRDYSKDESVNFLLKEIKDLKFKIGELKSENAELKDHNKKLRAIKIKEPKIIKQNATRPVDPAWGKDKFIMQLQERIKKIIKKKTDVENKMIKWRNDYFNLIAKVNKNI